MDLVFIPLKIFLYFCLWVFSVYFLKISIYLFWENRNFFHFLSTMLLGGTSFPTKVSQKTEQIWNSHWIADHDYSRGGLHSSDGHTFQKAASEFPSLSHTLTQTLTQWERCPAGGLGWLMSGTVLWGTWPNRWAASHQFSSTCSGKPASPLML